MIRTHADAYHFRRLMQHLPDAIYFKDRDSKFVICNAVQVQMLGAASMEDVIGKSDADFFGPQHASRAREDELRIMESGQALSNQIEKVDMPDGTIAWHSTSKAPLEDDDGNVVGILGVSRNITERKRLQDALEEANQVIAETSRKAGRSEIASIVIHNVGNILNSVNVTATMIEELSRQYESLDLDRLASSIRAQLESPDGDARGYLGKVATYIEAAGERYRQSCEDFEQEIARLQQDVSNIQRIIMLQQDMVSFWKRVQHRSVRSVVSDALEINRIALQRHGVVVEADLEETEEWQIPEFQTLQILLNFLSNGKYAFDASGILDPFIRIRSWVGAEHLHLSVQDNGPGVDPAIMDRIFELGFTTREGGHGIGLHSCQMAAKEVDGFIEAKSEGMGKGAEFVFSLPLTRCKRDE